MIEINNLTTNSVDEEFLKNVAEIVLKGENKKDFYLSIVLVGKARIRKLNKKYRNKNRATDVLSFGKNPQIDFAQKISAQEELGEIVICLREVKKNAKRNNLEFKKELSWVLIHGVLHLLGYVHEESEAEAEKMREKEQFYLSSI
jgi:rRNA maturation RNase YbeY